MKLFGMERIIRLLHRRPAACEAFSEQEYLALYPDVQEAVRNGVFASGYQHWVRHGRSEGRLPRRPGPAEPVAPSMPSAPSLEERYVSAAPSGQNIIDLFQGQWSTSFAAEPDLVATPGFAELFNDPRIEWLAERLGPLVGRSIIELGPLEGAHTRTLEALGAASIVAVESNTRAFLKCLCVKELFNLRTARFLLGDFNQYLDSCGRVDVIVASGVLYHMTDPVALLRRVCAKADRIFLWTHYYDPVLIASRDDHALFQPCDLGSARSLRGAKRLYPQAALSWAGFCGGGDEFSVWMERASIMKVFEEGGFRCESGFESPDHPNGPAFAVCARRE